MRHGHKYTAKPLSELMGSRFDVTQMGAGYKRGMVLKVAKAKMLELIGCKPAPVYLPEGLVPYAWCISYCVFRDFALGCAFRELDRSGLTDQQKARRRSFLGDLQGLKMVPQDREAKGYDNPTLIVRFDGRSPWRAEMQPRRYQLLMLLNRRLEDEFIKEVRVR